MEFIAEISLCHSNVRITMGKAKDLVLELLE